MSLTKLKPSTAILLTGMAGVFVVSGVALGKHDKRHEMRHEARAEITQSVFAGLDQDRNESLSVAEFVGVDLDKFDALDADGNGTLSPKEFSSFSPEVRVRAKQAMESVRAQKKAQAEARWEEKLAEADEDSRARMQEMREARQQKRDAERKLSELRKGRGGARHFHRIDQDGSGGITPEEFESALSKRFTHMDRDDNGTVSVDEFSAQAKQMAERRKGRRGGEGRRAGRESRHERGLENN